MWKLVPRNRCGSGCGPQSALEELEDLVDFPGWINYTVVGQPSQPRAIVEIYPEGEDFVLRAEIPGFKKENLELVVTGNTLNLKGSRTPKQPVKEGETTVEESWTRSVLLPAEVDTTRITATYEDGVLTAKLLRKEEAKPKQITIS